MGIARSKDDQPAPNIDLEKYSGKWYEIARLPSFFERNLDYVTATYTPNPDGTVKVENKGVRDSEEKSIVGKAWPVDDTHSRLKVQFYWPLTAPYWIINIDNDYKWAMVGNPNFDFLWILSRTPKMDENLYQELVQFSKELGYPVEKLERPIQS